MHPPQGKQEAPAALVAAQALAKAEHLLADQAILLPRLLPAAMALLMLLSKVIMAAASLVIRRRSIAAVVVVGLEDLGRQVLLQLPSRLVLVVWGNHQP
jgi:hypothetical protein